MSAVIPVPPFLDLLCVDHLNEMRSNEHNVQENPQEICLVLVGS